MDGEDLQAMGSGTQLPCKPEMLVVRENAGKVVFEHIKSQPNDEVLQIEGDGKERVEAITESGDFEFGVACLINHVQTSKISEEVSLSFESSHVTRNGSSYLISGECSKSSRDDTPTGGVRNKEAIFQLSHKERPSQLERMENRGGNAEAFTGEDVNHAICHITASMISNKGDDLCSQDWSTRSGCPLRHGDAANHGEGEDCQVVFERKLSFGNRESGPDMDESIWQSLPEDVEDKVLAWLPVASCARFRSVCKRWFNLMNSERFFQMHSRNVAHETWILSFGDQSPDPKLGFKYKGEVFDPVRKRTFMLEFPFLPENSVPVASAGGLVCFCCDSSSNEENDVSFYVCNPITKAWKFIPSPCSRVSVVTLVVDSESGFMGYKLYVFCEASVVRWLWVGVLDHSTKEYDSKLNRWKDVGDVHSGEQFKPGSVFRNGKVHLLSSEVVETLDVQQGNWIGMNAPAYASCATLLQRGDRLLVVGDMVHHNVFNLPNLSSYVGIVIWEFDPVIKAWIEVTRMPEAMVDSFSYSSFSCVIVRDLLYLFSRSCSLPGTMVYSFSEQLWSREPNRCEEASSKVFSFNPRLDACA